jgi:hypothetical protein
MKWPNFFIFDADRAASSAAAAEEHKENVLERQVMAHILSRVVIYSYSEELSAEVFKYEISVSDLCSQLPEGLVHPTILAQALLEYKSVLQSNKSHFNWTVNSQLFHSNIKHDSFGCFPKTNTEVRVQLHKTYSSLRGLLEVYKSSAVKRARNDQTSSPPLSSAEANELEIYLTKQFVGPSGYLELSPDVISVLAERYLRDTSEVRL